MQWLQNLQQKFVIEKSFKLIFFPLQKKKKEEMGL